MMKAGDAFYADYAKPQGFCDEAWKAIYQYVFALAHGADKSLFYYGDWIKKPGVAIVNDIAPEHEMEKILYAVDELTGLLGAVVLMYPSKSAKDLNLKSVKKKFKDKKFAAGCSRDVIRRGADQLGWTLDDLIARTIVAVQTFEA